MVSEYKLLNFINFIETSDWNIKQIFNTSEINSKYTKHKINSVLTRIKAQMFVEKNVMYKRLTIRINNNGVYVRDVINGSHIKTKKQFYVSAGQLAISKIDARNGAFGIVPIDADGAIITGNFWVYDVNKDLANIKYLEMLLSSDKFTKSWEECSNGSGNRLYLQEMKFLNYNIPLPALTIQNQLVDDYNAKIGQAEIAENNAALLEESIDEYLFESLEIKIPTIQKQSEKLLTSITFSKLLKWGAEVNICAINPQDLFKSAKYKNVSILTAYEINPTTKYPETIDDVSFLPMECISDVYGNIIELRDGKATNSKGYTRFKNNDVLWAKITPCMQNGKCVVAENLKNGFGYGSTEYHVFRAIKNKAIPSFVYHFLRTKIIRQVAQSYFTGSSGQQRVGSDFLDALYIPLPPIEIQNDIANHICSIKSEIKALKIKAENLRILAKKEFEEEIFNG